MLLLFENTQQKFKKHDDRNDQLEVAMVHLNIV